MKILHVLIFALLVVLGISKTALSQQSDCKVYLSEISDYYSGECKKGKANGKGIAEGIDVYKGEFKKGYPNGFGTYTYKNGNIYVGEFKMGRKDGKGEFRFQMYGKDTITVGYWRNDEYIGLTNKPPYKVLGKMSVDRLTFRHSDVTEDRVYIEFYQNGRQNPNISNVQIVSSTGSTLTQGQFLQIVDYQLPLVLQVRYNTLNTFKSSSIPCSFRVEINQKGRWDIRVNN